MSLLDAFATEARPRQVRVECGACHHVFTRSAETFSVASFAVHRCPDCLSLTTAPLPGDVELAAYYARYTGSYTAGMGSERYLTEMPKRWHARVEVLRALGGRGRLLDMGGANGMFAGIAHRSGYSVEVVDYVPEPIDLGFCTVRPSNLSEYGSAPFADGEFDVVTLWSCIEHVKDPGAAVAEAFRLTRPGGLLAVDTPLVGDLCERLFPARSHWICPPEHLHLFSERGLHALLRRGGFDIAYSAPFFERSKARWLARRGRNVAVAAAGLVLRASTPKRWESLRDSATTPAGDIQFVVARRP